MSSVAVLGAGPSGLITALLAGEAGHEVRVLEAAGHVGGMAASFEVAGQRVDYGSHRLHPSTPEHLMARLGTLLGDDLQKRERNGRIRLRSRWVGFPLRTVDMMRSLPLDFSARVALDTALSPLRRKSDGTFAGELTRRLGPAVVDEFYAPYSVKLYGEDARDLDAEHARRRVGASSPLSILLRAVRAASESGRRFWYPRNGYGQIAEALADAAVAAGVSIELSTPVGAVARRADGWTVGFGDRSFEADVVLSTIPLDALARALEPAPPRPVVDALDAVRTRAMVLVYLVVPRPQYTPFDAHYFPDSAVRIARLSEPKNYRDGDDPSDTTVLCAELPCWKGDESWMASDADLGALAADDLARAGLPDPAAVHVETRRLPSVYPVYEASTAESRATIDRWHSSLDDLLVFGRQGLGVPDNLHHVLAMGDGAVGALGPNGSIDRRVWAERRFEFASHVVQD